MLLARLSCGARPKPQAAFYCGVQGAVGLLVLLSRVIEMSPTFFVRHRARRAARFRTIQVYPKDMRVLP